MQEWTSRQRVIAAMQYQEADRVPVDLNLTIDVYLNLKKYLGLEIEEELHPSSFTEIRPPLRVLRELGVDIYFIKLRPPRNWRPPPTPPGETVDEWGVRRRRVDLPGGSYYMEVVHNPLASATSIKDLEDYPWPDPYAPGRDEGLAEEARDLYENTDFALMGRFGGPITEMAQYLLGWERWLLCLAMDPDFATALLTRITEIQMALDEIGLRATGKYLQIFKVSGEDMGMQDRPLVSLNTYQTLIRPYLRRRWLAAKEKFLNHNPQGKIMLHSCGSVRLYINDFIEDGVDILDPLQPLAADMEARQLKAEFGDRLIFHGGVDIQRVLPFGSEAEVEQEVIRCIRAFGPSGGYILAPAHYVQADVSPENLVAMCRAAQKYGRYPLRQERSDS